MDTPRQEYRTAQNFSAHEGKRAQVEVVGWLKSEG
jgi:hypothetical protein